MKTRSIRPTGVRSRVREPLAHALHVAGVRLLDPIAVHAHMRDEERRHSSHPLWLSVVPLLRNALPVAYVVGLGVTAIGVVFALIVGLVSLCAWSFTWSLCLPMLALAGVGVAIAFVSWFLGETLTVRRAAWIPTFYAEHRVPAWARDSAEEVLARLPLAHLEIEELVVNCEVVDPVLSASLGAERFYIAVWDADGREVRLPTLDF